MVNLNDPNIPILGQGKPQAEPNAPGLTANCEVHDSEIMEIEKVLDRLNDRASSGSIDLDSFDREIKDRFHQIGFIVDVAWWHTNVEGVKRPDIVIKDRTERKQFDHDQKVHEITNDILGLGDKGVIQSDPKALMGLGHHHKH